VAFGGNIQHHVVGGDNGDDDAWNMLSLAQCLYNVHISQTVQNAEKNGHVNYLQSYLLNGCG